MTQVGFACLENLDQVKTAHSRILRREMPIALHSTGNTDGNNMLENGGVSTEDVRIQ